MHDRIDVQNTQHKYELAVAAFERDPAISDRNKELVFRFIRDCRLGKAVWKGSRRSLSVTRCEGLLVHLKKIVRFFAKDLDQVTAADVEAFVEALETDSLRATPRRFGGEVGQGGKLSPGYKRDLKITLKKFYTYLWGTRGVPPGLVSWLDTRRVDVEVDALTTQEVQTILGYCARPKLRALVQVLFDGGFRIGEILNVRLSDLWLGQIDRHDASKRCFLLRIRYSKTLPRTVSLPMEESTVALRIWLREHPAKPKLQDDGTLDADDLSAQLFPYTGNGARLVIRRLGKKALGKRVYPHLLRHSSATYWAAQGLPEFRMKKRFGWTMSSAMLHRYIDRAGIREWEVGDVYYGNKRTELERENEALRRRVGELQVDAVGRETAAEGTRPRGKTHAKKSVLLPRPNWSAEPVKHLAPAREACLRTERLLLPMDMDGPRPRQRVRCREIACAEVTQGRRQARGIHPARYK